MSTVVYGRGKAKVTMTGALAGDLERDLLASIGPLGTEIKARADGLLEQARSQWPIRTGASRRGLHVATIVDPVRTSIRCSIYGSTSYDYFIRWHSSEFEVDAKKRRITIDDPIAPGGWDLVSEGESKKGYYRVYRPSPTFKSGARTPGRGGVVLDLLRSPGKAVQAELKAALPGIVADLLKRAGSVS